jgi:AcrR family transcriptional regulator
MKKSQETSRRILEAAFQRIARRGCNQVTLREIAMEAGVALSQLNYYYTNKERLFSEVLRAMRQEYLANLETRMRPCATLQEKLACLISYNRQLLSSNRELYGAFLEFFNLAMWSASFRIEMNQFLEEIAATIDRHLQGRAAPEAQPPGAAPGAPTRLILGASFGIAMQFLMDPAQEHLLDSFDTLQALVAGTAPGPG